MRYIVPEWEIVQGRTKAKPLRFNINPNAIAGLGPGFDVKL